MVKIRVNLTGIDKYPKKMIFPPSFPIILGVHFNVQVWTPFTAQLCNVSCLVLQYFFGFTIFLIWTAFTAQLCNISGTL